MSRLLYAVFIPLLMFVLVSETECIQRDQPFVHVRLREVNCSLPCQRDDNGTCVDDCPLCSYCDDYFHTCVGCPQHCVLCMSSDFCEECEDGFQVVGGGMCKASCEFGYYDSPFATQCLACSPHCLNCSGLNQCHNCSDNYSLYDDIARQVCVLPCSNGSFYNQTTDQCQACAEHCKRCIPSLGCVQCKDNYIINDNFCLLATPTITKQSTATPTITMQSTATPTATLQPAGSNKHDESTYYIVGGVVGGVIAIVTPTIIVIIVVYCRGRRSSADSKPLLRFDEDMDEEDNNNDN